MEGVIDGGEDDARRRSRLSYEEKYRKVVGKFRTKLAVKEAMLQSLLLTQQRNQHQQYGGAHPPDHRIGNAIRIMSGNHSVLSVPGVGAVGMGNAAYSIMSVGDVVERRLRRRERRMENAKRSKPKRTICGGDGKEYLDNDQEGGDRPVNEEKKYSHSWVDAVTSVESNLSEKMPSGHDGSDVLLVEGGVGERKTNPLSAKESEDPTVAEEGAAAAVVNLPHYQEAERLNSLGNSLMKQKQFQDALDTYTLAVNLAPAGPRSHVYYSNRSAAYLSLNMNEHSIRDCERSIALIKPTEGGEGGGGEYYSKAHSRLGLAYFACGRYREAVDAYEKSLEMEPNNKWTRDHLEKAMARIISSTIGENEETKAASGSPEESTANIMVAESEGGGGGGGGVSNERDIIAEQLLRADDHKNKGNALMSSKQYTEALHQYDLAIKTSPSGPNTYVYYSNRAAAFCYLGNYVNAMNDCRRSIGLNPMYEKAYSRLGLSLFFQDEYEGAISAYETSLALDPSNKASLSYLSKAKSRLAEQQNEKKAAREEKDMKTSEEREKTRRRMEWLHLQKSKGQQQQYQVSTGGIAENEDREGDSQRSAGIESFVNDEIAEVSAKSGDINKL
ncbi:hypothetical protein ACHAW5_000346 [Stephanodiscus triporus]|uniref:UDP-N-acetylglucosamine--peptide N-acetylglucosaminyltransferase SPINDLY n=1 Tax=Stephanodiscus triporus TaxID=2934178 RepID=A0ABD3MIN6_9STRA